MLNGVLSTTGEPDEKSGRIVWAWCADIDQTSQRHSGTRLICR